MFLVKYSLILGILVTLCCYNRVESKINFPNGLGKLVNAIGHLLEFTDPCKYKCLNGGRPMTNVSHKPTADGCGSYGTHFEISAVPGATQCCDKHDYCYDDCNHNKAKCDVALKTCLDKICKDRTVVPKEKKGVCSTVVDYIFGGVSALGCEAYLAAQRKACICV